MPVIIYGTREYGRVDAHAGEHASTRFFHIWFAPLIPVGSSWFTGLRPDGTNGHGIKLHGKSVAAGYLRIWGPIVALGTLSAGIPHGSLGPLVTAALATLLTVWAWSWRTLRDPQAIRRSDFNFVAFGTRCEPKRLLAPYRVGAKRSLDQRWSERAPSRSPNEVAAHGAADAAEAVLAYGLLQLSAIERGRAGATDGADAARILAGQHDAPTTTDGPYRAGMVAPVDAATQSGLAELVNQRAAEGAKIAAAYAPDPSYELRRAKRRSRWQGAGLVLLSMAAVGGVMGFVATLRPTLEIGIKELRSVHPPRTRTVQVTCDTIEPPLWEETTDHGKTTARIAMCELGRYLVPVKFGADGALPARVVTGRLRDVDDRQLWVRQGLHTDPQLEARSLDVYIDATQDGADRIGGAIGLAIALATPVLWVLWVRARRRRKAAERAQAAR